jgi:alpha-amylase/alpha-mannosidase (GH57 family)
VHELNDVQFHAPTSMAAFPEIAPLSGVHVVLHGHFYQPPRENPYLGTIDRQASAAPFHDWNERIHHECYRPNAFARILNERGEVVEIVNNFEYLSFNIGPTLMRWLENHDAEVYQRILEADRKSCERLNGHGNAIAQVYNHIILPLANERDKLTQIRWGKADFQSRFGRLPEGMWLAEAAIDTPTLTALIAEGIRFIILAPSQVERCRPIPDNPDADEETAPWQEVGGEQIDPTQPYRCFLPGGDRNRDYIDIFFYDGPISRDVGFDDSLIARSEHLAMRLAQAVRGDRPDGQLIAIATDGETFGHHKRDTERSLAYAFKQEFPQRDWQVTNFAHYLSLHPPTWEVELKPITAWSCSHGVDRWQDDCGCGGDGGTWHQQWRRPLRDSLDWLRDQLIPIFTDYGEILLQNPWQARDEYIHVLLGQSHHPDLTAIDAFLEKHQCYPLSDTEQVDALRMLEMQRYALLMYTSCGWFFEELSRPEGVQILRYAARAIALAQELSGVILETEFIQRLALAPSNVETFVNGAEVYRLLVVPSQVTLHQVAAHYAMTSLFSPYPPTVQVYDYQVQQLDYQLQRMGAFTLAVGHLNLTSTVTREVANLMFAVLHLGGWDFHCVVQPFSDRRHYVETKLGLFEQLKAASAAPLILAMNDRFASQHYGLQDLFAEERHRLIDLLSQDTLTRLDQLYTQVYRNNYGLLMAYQRDELPIPQPLLVAAQVALSHRATLAVQRLEQALSNGIVESYNSSASISELEAIATEVSHLGCTLNLGQAEKQLAGLLQRWLWQQLYDEEVGQVNGSLQRFLQVLNIGQHLRLDVQIDRLQELYSHFLKDESRSLIDTVGQEINSLDTSTKLLLKLGQQLGVVSSQLL